MAKQKILITLDDQGGASIGWNYKELSPALRHDMKHHEPTVVLEHGETENSNIRSSVEGKWGSVPDK